MQQTGNLGVFDELYKQFGTMGIVQDNPPLLAHYTTIDTLEKILRDEQLWFSNPLFMNDFQELRFGISTGANIFLNSPEVRDSMQSTSRADLIFGEFSKHLQLDRDKTVLDTYIFCLSEHGQSDSDGRLSMWRAYGGRGNGAALVLNIAPLKAQTGPVPILLSKVRYKTFEQQTEMLAVLISSWCNAVRLANIPDDLLSWAALNAFLLIKYFALTTKHSGFDEEKEWRLIYTSENDHTRFLSDSLSYIIGPRGVEPKLKFKIAPIPGLNLPDMSLATFLDRIILGPTVSQPLAFASIKRMIDSIGKPRFNQLLRASSIPFRDV